MRVSRTEGRVLVKPAARRMCRIGGRRRVGCRGFVAMVDGLEGELESRRRGSERIR